MRDNDLEWLKMSLDAIRDDIKEVKEDIKVVRKEGSETAVLVNSLKVKFGMIAAVFGTSASMVWQYVTKDK